MAAPAPEHDPRATVTRPMAAIFETQAIGDWTLERKLGSGAMGDVFLAHRASDGVRAALKLVNTKWADDPAFIQRFEREIAVLAQLDHPNVARALDWGEHQHQPWLAMEYIDGPELQVLLDRQGIFFEAEVLHLAIQVARGLAHIHTEAGLIHRDVKPANILVARAPGGDPTRLLNPGDHAKLIDFGLAKATDTDDQRLTMTGMIMGTPHYISPEQVQCEKNLTFHCDMYALGATVFHLLTGHPPYQAASAAAVMAAHLNQPVPDPGQAVPALHSGTRSLVRTALAKKPGDRYADWRAFIVACEKALKELGEAPVTTGRISRHPGGSPTPGKPLPASQTPGRPVPTTSAHRPTTDRSVRPTPVAPTPAHRDPALVPRPGTIPSAAPATGADALRQVVSSKIIHAQPSSSIRRKDPVSAAVVRPPRAHNPQTSSAVYRTSDRLDATQVTGGAILPWVVLAGALLATILGAVYVLRT